MRLNSRFVLITDKQNERIKNSFAILPVFLDDGTFVWFDTYRKYQIKVYEAYRGFVWVTKIKY